MSPPPQTDRDIELLLSTPTRGAIEAVAALKGNFMVLGVGGKMGTSTAVMLRRALDAAGRPEAVVTGVSRFSRTEARADLESLGVRTLSCDLAEATQLAALPDTPNVLFLAGQKFGTDSAPELTWMQNTIVPALVAQRFRDSRLVIFSTGCVYPFVPTTGPGANEREPVAFLANTPAPASAGSGSSPTTRSSSAPPSSFTDSTTPSNFATAFWWTSRRRSGRARPSM